jgi:AraC-like DNA-binding protein
MLAQDYLTLRLVRLKPPEEWINKQGGLSFVFPKGGAGRCLCGPLNQRLGPGDVLVLDGAAGGKLCAPDRGEMVFACFSVCFEHLLPLFASSEICLLQGVTDGFKRAKLYPASSPLAVECHRLLGEVPPQFNLDHRGQLLRVAAAILTVEFMNAHGQRVGFIRPEDHMIQVFEKLSAAELVGLSVPELAGKFGCSRRHLNRLFHQHFGVSVAAIRMEMRLLKAVALLRNPDSKVINVAEECGFNHLGLFNTCFKRRFGTSPGQWRKRAVPNEDQPARPGGIAPNCPLRISGLCPWTGQPGNSAAASPKPLQAQKPRPAKASIVDHALDGSAELVLLAAQQKLNKSPSSRPFAANR